MSDFEKLKNELKDKLSRAQNSKEVEDIRVTIFGKNGFINSEFKKLGSLNEEEKKKVASEINKAKQELTKLFAEKSLKLKDIEIDYSDDLLNGGFKIKNPNAERTCGCGTSFSA